MSSSTPDDLGLETVSDLPPELLSTLRDTLNRGEPLHANKAFQGLPPSTQQEISASLRDLEQPTPVARRGQPSLAQPKRRVPEDTGADAQSRTTRIASPTSAEPLAARAADTPEPEVGEAGTQDPHGAGPAPLRQRTGPATAQARGPVFTEGSDGTSPYKPPQHAGQRPGSNQQEARAQTSQGLLQARLLLTVQSSCILVVP